MFKLLRKHQKRILGVLGAVLMIGFIYGLVPKTGQSGFTDHVVGNLDGTSVKKSEMNFARNEWQTLRTLQYVDPNDPNATGSFARKVLGGVADIISKQQSQDLFFLLIQEANKRGLVVDNDEVQSALTNNIGNLPPEGSDSRPLVEQAVADCLLVQALTANNLEVVKATIPVQNWALARYAQQFSLSVVNFSAAHFQPKVPVPTDADLKNQFDTFSDRLPGQFGTPGNPLGFGYEYPKRVKLQYIGLKFADVRLAAEASKSKEDWYVAAYGEFKNNREAYDDQPVSVPTTQPTKGGAASTPVVRKLDDFDQDFALHVPLVLEKLYSDAAYKLRRDAAKQISDLMDSNYATWHDSQNNATTTPTTQEDPNSYASSNFIYDLSGAVEKQFGITPVIGMIGQFRDQEQLTNLQGIGHSFLALSQTQITPFYKYATDEVEQGGLALWQPSDPLTTQYTGDVYLFRVTAVDAPHTPPMDEVKDQVVADYTAAAAYKLALDAAQASARLIHDKGMAVGAPVAMANGGSSPVATDLFSPQAVANEPNAPKLISPLVLKPESAVLLAQATEELLTESPGIDGRPVSVAELWPDALAAVIELRETVPDWDETQTGAAQADAMRVALQPQATKIVTGLFNYEAAAQRLNFRPDESLQAATTQP
jgi:hypothetical protein